MNDAYKEIHDKVRDLRFNVQDWLDDKGHQLGQALQREVQRLEDELEMQKSPRSIEDRIKDIIKQLRVIEDNSHIMDGRHADELRDNFEDLRRDLRALPNY